MVARPAPPVTARAPGRAVAVTLAVLGGAALGGACGPTARTPTLTAAQSAFLAAVHEQDPAIHELRSDPQLLRLGSAACAGFASGVSFFSLADTMAVNDGQLPTADLGSVITAAAEHLCPRYRSRVS
jgi:hypothetical protein